MKATSHEFIERSRTGLEDTELQKSLTRFQTGFSSKRADAVARLPEFEDLRDAAVEIKNHTLKNLDFYLEYFADQVEAKGGYVHWCEKPEDARQTILEICKEVNARTVTKSKSMIGEEIGLNSFLEDNNIEPVETDLGSGQTRN